MIVKSLDNSNKNPKVSEKINQTLKKQEDLIKQVAQNVGLGAEDQVVNTVSSMISAVTDSAKNNNSSVNQGAAATSNNLSEADVRRHGNQGRARATSSESVFIPSARGKENVDHGTGTPVDLNAEKKNIDDFAKTIKKDDFPGQGADNLRAKLETRSRKTGQALTEGDLGKAEQLIGESRRLMDNAKFFLKSKPVKSNDKKKTLENPSPPSQNIKDPIESPIGTSTVETDINTEKATSLIRQKAYNRGKNKR